MNRSHVQRFLFAFAMCSILPLSVRAQEKTVLATVDSKTPAAAQKPSTTSVRRALIICGLAGDAEHAKAFGDSLELLHTGLTTYQGFTTENIRILWGQAPTDKDPPAVRTSRGIASQETIAQTVEALQAELRPDDVLWVFVFGHTHFDGRHTWLNVAGPDVSNVDFGRLFGSITCQEQVFFITTPSSGYFLKPLGQAGRVVITATEADLEVNETRFPHRLVQSLGKPPEFADLEIDRDGQPTLLDLYLFTVRETALEYSSGSLLATEHALLDDNGDGRGSEIQLDYLPEELGGRRRKPNAPPHILKGDGLRARQIRIALPPAPDSPPPPELPTSE